MGAAGITRASQLSTGLSSKSPGPIYRPNYDLISSAPKQAKVSEGERAPA